MTDLQRQVVYLAGLLHDIGKFYQRGDVYYENSSKLTSTSKKIADYICPIGKNKVPGYQHVIWTHDFFELPKIEDKLKRLGLNSSSGLEDKESDTLLTLSCYHHNPQTFLQSIIQMADWWSSGMDRNKRYDTDENQFKEYSNFREVRLIPVFEQLIVNESLGQKQDYTMPLKPLDIDTSCFPESLDTYQQEQYDKLWKEFLKEIDLIPVYEGKENQSEAIEAFGETLLFLLKKYTWCVPSSAHKKDLPDVNLYDHLRTTGAIAQCLYDYWNKNREGFELNQIAGRKRLIIKEGHYPLMLFCGDISGIQKYIYDIYSSKAAKSLKGRSFFLQLLVETLVQKIITRCHVTLGHVVYASGGKFYMLLPNTESVCQALKEIEEETARNIHNEYHGALYVCMDYIPFCYHFEEGKGSISMLLEKNKNHQSTNLGELWRKLSEKTGMKKQQKFKQTMLDDFDSFFLPENITNVEQICAVTGQFFEDEKDKIEIGQDENNQPVYVKAKVYEQISLGEKLKDADYFITYRSPEFARKLKIKDHEPLSLGIRHHLFDSEHLTFDNAEFRKVSSVDTARVRRINQTDFNLINTLKGNRTSYGFTFYGGNQQAKITDEKPGKSRNKTFEELAEYSAGQKTKLGVLRMDVDNLGKLFMHGIPEEKRNLSRYATLSSQLDWFFSGYLNTIRDKDYPKDEDRNPLFKTASGEVEYFKDWVNILYSGGDDVFAVGRWDMLIAFAEEVRSSFRRFVCGREDISISAGIAIISPKFPIAKAAELAGEAEKKAKKFTLDGDKPKKNTFCLFGQVVSWENEFVEVKGIKTKLVHLIGNQHLSAGILQKFILFQQVENKNSGSGKTDKSYIWNAAYYLAKYRERFKNHSEHAAVIFLDELKNKLYTSGGFPPYERYFDLVALAARWAEYELKSNN